MLKRAIAIAVVTIAAPALLLAGFPEPLADALRSADLIYLATMRKDGTRSAAAPIWFVVMDDAVWVNTSPTSHKVARIKRGSPAFLAVSQDGPFVEAKAEIVRNGEVAERLGELYGQKYWIAWLGLFRPRASRVTSGKSVLIKLTPK